MSDHTPISDELAGLLRALPHLKGDAKRMALDAILSNLRYSAPRVARLVAEIIGALDTEIGDAVVQEFGQYDGTAGWDEIGESTVDCLLLTIKSVELQAVLAAFGVPFDSYQIADRDLRHWRVEHDGRRYAIAKVGTDGNAEAAIYFGRLYAALRPLTAVMVGMAGGLHGKVSAGDVVVAEHVYAWDFRKLVADGELRRAKTSRVNDRYIRDVTDIDSLASGWRTKVARDLRIVLAAGDYDSEGATIPTDGWRPKVERGDILAGSSLVEDGSLPDLAVKHHDRVRAVEMESAGFAAACEELDVPWLVVRGIADAGEPGRDDHWQFGSTFVAARLVRDGLASGALNLPQGKS